jgi:hypothetical protein
LLILKKLSKYLDFLDGEKKLEFESVKRIYNKRKKTKTKRYDSNSGSSSDGGNIDDIRDDEEKEDETDVFEKASRFSHKKKKKN